MLNSTEQSMDASSFLHGNWSDTSSSAVNTTAPSAPHGCRVLNFHDFVPWDNPDNVVSYHTEESIRRVKYLLLAVLFLIGGPANVINMAVFCRQGLKERVNVCLFALSLADELFLAANVVRYGEQLRLMFTTNAEHGPVFTFLMNHNLLAFQAFAWVSQVITAIIAMDRCLCIMRPLRSHNAMSAAVTARLIGAVSLLLLGLYGVVAFRYRVGCVFDPQTETFTRAEIAGEVYLRYKTFIDYLDVLVFGVGIPVVVMVLVAISTALTTVKLRQAAAWRAGAGTTSSSGAGVSAQEMAVTKMLVCNSAFFMVCVTPVVLYKFARFFDPELNAGRRHYNMYRSVLWLTHILQYINATFNIAVYYSTGSRFRRTFWALLGLGNMECKTEVPNSSQMRVTRVVILVNSPAR